jgi:hypothetical protein
MLVEQDIAPIRRRCEAVLRKNWREGTRRRDGVPFAYTCPSPGHYPWQWYWDSCFTAITWRHFDPARARRELESLLAAQTDDGFIGHTIFWNTPLRGRRRFTYNIASPGAPMTSSIQPPALAWAWLIAVGDPSRVPAITRHYDWLADHRDLDGDGLIWIVQPDESGLDASPQFDVIWGSHAHGLPLFVLLVRRKPRSSPAVTWSALAPLALPDLPDEIGRRLVEGHLLDGERFWLPVPPPSVSAADSSFSLDDAGMLGLRRYWRGPTWINAAWLVWLGLVRLGYTEQAQELSARMSAAVSSEGLREYYNPYSGRGMGAADFGWSTLVLEMLDPDPRAASSYLEG